MANVKVQDGGDISNGKFYRLSIYAALDNNQLGIMNMALYCTSAAGAGVVTFGDVALDRVNSLDAVIQPVMAIQAKFLGCKVSALDTVPRPLPGIATSTSSGSMTNPALPGQVSGIISWLTPLAGQKYRGRVYVPFPGADGNDTDNTPTAAYVNNLDNLGVVLIAPFGVTVAFATVNLTPVIYHRADNTGSNVTAFRSNKLWSTQKRRGNYGRTNAPVIR